MFVSQAQTDRFLMQQTHFVVRMLSAPGIAAIFTACSSSGSGKITPSDVAPDSQTRLAPSVPGSVVEFAYVANESSNNVSAYTINPTSGALTPVTGSPFGAGKFLAPWQSTPRASSSMSLTPRATTFLVIKSRVTAR
jgi:hypothetical protein